MIIRFIFSFILLASIYAGANDFYVIKNIKISSSNRSASIARNQAVEDGQMKAFRGLVKLHYPEAESKINTIDREDIFSLVESYELSDEKRSATMYYAKLKVRFSRAHVDKLMKSIGVRFSGTISKRGDFREEDKIMPVLAPTNKVKAPALTTLAIPVFIQDNHYYWLEDDNAWLDIWQEHKLSNKFVLPLVDIEDLRIINKNIISKNLIDLSSLLEKYNVNNIAIYNLEDVKDGKNHRISLKVNYINKYHYSWQTHHFTDDAGSNISQLLNVAYDKAQKFNFDNSEGANKFMSVAPQIISVDFPVNKISDWLNLQEILKSITYISDVQLEKMTIQNYYFSFTSMISIDDLKVLFEKYGFSLEEQNNDNFILTRDSINKYNNYEGLGNER